MSPNLSESSTASRQRKGPAALGKRDRDLLKTATAVIGVDEAGRGSLAGPVVVAAVAFDDIPDNPLIQDSKTLTARQREEAAVWVRSKCSGWTLVETWVELIDRLNILEATRLAMGAAARTVARSGSVVVFDCVNVPMGDTRILSPKRADSSFFCVAAASILAKVHRDSLMRELDSRYPVWGWRRNKGYGTAAHREALSCLGRSFLHRRSFRFSAP